MATIKGLRGVLGAHFDEAETVLRRLAEAGVLPNGRPGVGGSAAIDPPHCATVLLGLASLAWCDPSGVPAEARRLAGFRRLPRRDLLLLDILSGEIIDAGRSVGPASWRVSQWAVARERSGEAPVRFVAADAPAVAGLAIRETVLDGALVAAVGRLFAATAGKRAA